MQRTGRGYGRQQQMIVSYTMEGTKVWEMRNVEPASILWNRKKNTNKSTMKSLVLLHVLLTMQVKSLRALQLLLLLHNQHRAYCIGWWRYYRAGIYAILTISFILDAVLLGVWGLGFHHFKGCFKACQSRVRDQRPRWQRCTKEPTLLVMLSLLICLTGLAKDELSKRTGVLFTSISWWCLRRETNKQKTNPNNNNHHQWNAASARKHPSGLKPSTLAPSTAEDKEGARTGLPPDSCARRRRGTGPEMPRHVWLRWDRRLQPSPTRSPARWAKWRRRAPSEEANFALKLLALVLAGVCSVYVVRTEH